MIVPETELIVVTNPYYQIKSLYLSLTDLERLLASLGNIPTNYHVDELTSEAGCEWGGCGRTKMQTVLKRDSTPVLVSEFTSIDLGHTYIEDEDPNQRQRITSLLERDETAQRVMRQLAPAFLRRTVA